MPAEVIVTVPATSANLGPGYDALGIALEVRSSFQFKTLESGLQIDVSGEGAESISRDGHNLAYRAFEAAFRAAGEEAPPVSIDIDSAIPVSRGMGASASAVVAGVVAGNTMMGGRLSEQQMLDLASELEGHPDNVTPALTGAFTVATLADGHVVHVRLAVPDGLRVVVCIPELHMPTKAARNILPEHVSLSDAVFNLSRAALMVASITSGAWELLHVASQDRLHQPYRANLLPGFREIMQAALDAGAHGAFLSGAGSTIAALATTRELEIAEAMFHTAIAHGLDARTLVTQVSQQGARVEHEHK